MANCSRISTSDVQKQIGNIHWLPAEIQHDGDANVQHYFESSIRKNETQNMTASLRGRPLHGTIMEVPSGYTGVILKEARRPFNEDEERQLTASETFTNVHYWNLDRDPSAEDKFQQALLWLDVSKTLHQPVDEDSSQSSVVSQ